VIPPYHAVGELTNFGRGQLDDKRGGDTRFAPLADFLEAVPVACPHDLCRDDDPKARASQAKPAFADSTHVVVNRKQNAATELADLIIPAVGNNKLRHEKSCAVPHQAQRKSLHGARDRADPYPTCA
jgi:hypothetical protein